MSVRRLMAGLLAVLAVGLAAPAVAAAVAFNVNTTADNPAADCSGGACSLRGAVNAANTFGTGTVTINVPAGTYTLTTGTELQLHPIVSVAIAGAGASSTTISGGGSTRVFEISSGTVKISRVTIANGSPSGGGPGGGIDVSGAASVTIDSSTISDNTSEDGGGVFVAFGAGSVTIDSSTISGNVVTDGGSGGGIEARGGTVTITNSTISGNHADTGIGSGGGVDAAGGSFSFFADTISTNTAAFVGGGFDNSGFGGSGVADKSDSFVDTTIVGNSAQFDGGGIEPGVIPAEPPLPAEKISFSTITDNSAAVGGNIGDGIGHGGHGGAFIDDSIVARGSGAFPNCAVPLPAPPVTVSLGFNLFDDTKDSGAQCGATGTDIVKATAKLGLGSLGNNGGPTETEALSPPSPAIDAASDIVCTSETTPPGGGKAVDQRGVSRPQPAGGHCDIGAYELVPSSGGGGGFDFQPDLALSASVQNNPMTVGDQNTVTDTITNAPNTSDATNVTFSDPVAGFSINSVTPSQGTCTNTSTTVSCNLGTLPSGQSATVQINLTANSVGTITLNSSVSMDQTDPTPADNSATTLITVNAPADLALSTSAQNNPILVGAQDSVTDTITNSGGQSATNVTFTDPVAGFSINSVTPSQGSCTNTATTVSCNLGTIAGGGSAAVQINLTGNSAGVLTLNSTVSMDQTDPTPADNSATTLITVNTPADLALSPSVQNNPATVGAQDIVTDTITNSGGQSATHVTFTDPAAGFTINSVTPSQGSCTHTAATVSCSLGTIGGGGSATVQVNLTPTSAGTLTLNSAVSMDQIDPTPGDNTATTLITVNTPADLALSPSVQNNPATVGAQDDVTDTITNSGGQSATNVTFTDSAAGFTINQVAPSQGSCTNTATTVTCKLGTITGGGSATVEINLTPTSAGTLTLNSAVSMDQTDPTPADNTAATEITVNRPADLHLRAAAVIFPLVVGEQDLVTDRVFNVGGQTATNVILTDPAAGFTILSVAPGQGSCTHTVATVACHLGDLAPSHGVQVRIFVVPTTIGTLTLSSAVSMTQADPTPSDNSATLRIRVTS